MPAGMLSNYSPAAGLIPTITACKADAYIVSPNSLGKEIRLSASSVARKSLGSHSGHIRFPL